MTNENGESRHRSGVEQDDIAAGLPIDPRDTDHPTGESQAAENMAEDSPS